MRIKTLLAPVIIGLLSYTAAQAADWYAVTLRGSCSYLADTDKILKRPVNNVSLIRDYIATQTEPPLEKQLKLAYDPEADKISIVNTNGESVADVYSFGSATVVANSTDTQRIRHVFLFPEGISEAKGTAQITERVTRDGENTIIKLVSKGTFNFAMAATAETPAQICSGTFGVGKKLKFASTEPAPEPTP